MIMFCGFQRAISHTQGSLLGNGLDRIKNNVLPNNIMLLVTIEKFETNHVLVNVNKLKPYKYMEYEVQKQEQQMPIYWGQSVGGIQAENFDIKVDDEDYEIQKPHMKNVKDEEQIKDPTMNTILIFNLQMNNKFMNNNCRSEGFGIQISKDDMSKVSAKLVPIFTQTSYIFAQSSYLLPQSTKN